MKNGLLILISIALVFYLYGTFVMSEKTVSKEEFEHTHKRLKQQIDSVLRNCDSLKNELRAVRKNTDTLKAGQEIIFKTMNENKGKSFFDLF
ncbi:MAG: hypothetical protein II956_13340 [Bacteroidales bacterium]|nr:hypothetical protein [Bacteroidales bacterium]